MCQGKQFGEVRKKFNRGKGSKNSVGKETHFTVSLNRKRRAVQMMDDNVSFPEIQRKLWDLTDETFFLVNLRQLDNWKRATAKLDGLQPSWARRLSGAGRKTTFVGVDIALWKWFCERRAKSLAVTAKKMKTEAARVAHQGGYVVTQKWIRLFRRINRITLQKSHLTPAIILKLHSPKVLSNPNNLLVTSKLTRVSNSDYMRDTFIPYLLKQLQKMAGEALVALDSATAHITPAVLNTFRRAGLRYAIIPGGLTMFIQAIDVALMALCREEHHALYMQMVEVGRKVSASACRNAYIDLPLRGNMAALKRLNVPQTFRDLGYIDPTKV